eukprot:PhM_4_TR3758/c2_g1_i1/m.4662
MTTDRLLSSSSLGATTATTTTTIVNALSSAAIMPSVFSVHHHALRLNNERVTASHVPPSPLQSARGVPAPPHPPPSAAGSEVSSSRSRMKTNTFFNVKLKGRQDNQNHQDVQHIQQQQKALPKLLSVHNNRNSNNNTPLTARQTSTISSGGFLDSRFPSLMPVPPSSSSSSQRPRTVPRLTLSDLYQSQGSNVPLRDDAVTRGSVSTYRESILSDGDLEDPQLMIDELEDFDSKLREQEQQAVVVVTNCNNNYNDHHHLMLPDTGSSSSLTAIGRGDRGGDDSVLRVLFHLRLSQKSSIFRILSELSHAQLEYRIHVARMSFQSVQIDKEEFRHLLSELLRVDPNDVDLKESHTLFELFDANRSGVVDYDEFVDGIALLLEKNANSAMFRWLQGILERPFPNKLISCFEITLLCSAVLSYYGNSDDVVKTLDERLWGNLMFWSNSQIAASAFRKHILDDPKLKKLFCSLPRSAWLWSLQRQRQNQSQQKQTSQQADSKQATKQRQKETTTTKATIPSPRKLPSLPPPSPSPPPSGYSQKRFSLEARDLIKYTRIEPSDAMQGTTSQEVMDNVSALRRRRSTRIDDLRVPVRVVRVDDLAQVASQQGSPTKRRDSLSVPASVRFVGPETDEQLQQERRSVSRSNRNSPTMSSAAAAAAARPVKADQFRDPDYVRQVDVQEHGNPQYFSMGGTVWRKYEGANPQPV